MTDAKAPTPKLPELTPLQQSMIVFAGLLNQIHPTVLSVTRRQDNGMDDDLAFVLTNYMLILVSSFQQEWGRFEKLGEADTAVAETVRIASPAVERIEHWNGIYEYRSSVLAHPFRRKDRSVVSRHSIGGKVPTTYAEQLLLAQCALFGIAVAVVRHKAAYDEAAKDWPDHPISSQGIKGREAFQKDRDAIRDVIVSLDPSLSEPLANVYV